MALFFFLVMILAPCLECCCSLYFLNCFPSITFLFTLFTFIISTLLSVGNCFWRFFLSALATGTYQHGMEPTLFLFSTFGCPLMDVPTMILSWNMHVSGILRRRIPTWFQCREVVAFCCSQEIIRWTTAFFEGALPVQTHFQISTQAIFSGVKKWILCSQFC